MNGSTWVWPYSGLGAWLIVSFRIKNLKKHIKRILDLLEKDGGSNE